MLRPFIFFTVLLSAACRQPDNDTASGNNVSFSQPVPVTITGYNGHSMEPFISPDGNTLFFNNLNAAPENTNLHWATRVNDSLYQYRGEIAGINSDELDGVPSIDSFGNCYFISIRSYTTTLSSLYQCNYSNGAAGNIQLMESVSLHLPGWLIFDGAVHEGGQTLYITDGRFDNSPIPAEADLAIATKQGGLFQRAANSNELLKNINTPALEYAPCISNNQLELYFTRLKLPVTPNSTPQIMVATRKTIAEPFGTPSLISSITGFAEAPSLSPDQQWIYFHQKVTDRFVLYRTRKL